MEHHGTYIAYMKQNCLSVRHVWRGGGAAEGDGEGGQEGGAQWEGRISMMECQGGHTFASNGRSPS